MKNKMFAILVGAFILSASSAFGSLALGLSNVTGDGSNDNNWTLGWQFSVSSTINVTALGVYDSGQNGLAESHAIGIWNSSGSLLASLTIAAGGGTLDNYFRFQNLTTALNIGPGNYVVGARMGSENYISSQNGAVITTAPGITFIQDRYINSASLALPTSTDVGTAAGWFGANFQFTEVSAVPEPSTYIAGALLLLPFGAHTIRRLRTPKQVS